MIKDFQDRERFSGIFLVKDVTKGTKVDGQSYLSVTLQDNSGTIDAKKWIVTSNDIKLLVPGTAVRVDGEVRIYKEKLQASIDAVYEVDLNTIDLTDLLIQSPIPVETLISKFKYFLSSIKNDDCKNILNYIFKKYYQDFINYPAAVRNHHEFYHGLLYHTVSMCEVAEGISKHYSDVDYDILISGCLLHDVGKVIEFSGVIGTKYTNEGNLLGHLTIGMSLIDEAKKALDIKSEVPLLLEHMVLSHHGKVEYGAAVVPITREALLLSMIDDMDAKMMILDKAYDNVEEGAYTERIFPLENRSFYKPKKY